MSRNTFRVLSYLKRNAPKKNGLVPVMCRITINGKISQFSCKLDMEEKLWNVGLGRMSGRSVAAKEANRMLDKIHVGINKPIRKLWIGMVMCLPRKSERHSWVWYKTIRPYLPYSADIMRIMPNKSVK